MHDQHSTDRQDCVAALQELYVFLDGELTVERRTVIRGHLDHCTNCLEAFDFEAELRTVVAVRCQADSVPETLRQRVAEALRRTEAEH